MHFSVKELQAQGSLVMNQSLEAEKLLGPAGEYVSYEGPVAVHSEAHMTHGDVLVRATAKCALNLVCGRCLKNFRKEIVSSIDEIYKPEGEYIDAEPEVREAVLLDIPYAAVCSDTCLGICVECGKNKNTGECRCKAKQGDARWDALRHLKI